MHLLARLASLLTGLVCLTALLISCMPAPTPGPTPTPRAPVLIATLRVTGFDVPSSIAVNRRTDHVYVTLSDHIAVFKGIENVAHLATAQEWAESVAIDEANDWAYVVNTWSGSISAIHNSQLITNVIIPEIDFVAVTIEPKSHWAYAVSGFNMRPNRQKYKFESHILVLNGAKPVANLPFDGVLFTHIIADANGYVYAGDRHGAIVIVKDLKEMGRYAGGQNGSGLDSVRDMSVDPRTDHMFVLDESNMIAKFKNGILVDKARITNERNKTYELIRVHPLTGKIYLLNKGVKQVVIIDNWKEIARVPVGGEPVRMEIDPLTGNVYVANFRDGTVTVINDTKVLDTIKTGWHPAAIGINPNNGWLYVTNSGDQTISVLGYPPPNFTPPAPTKAPLVSTPPRPPTPRAYP